VTSKALARAARRVGTLRGERQAHSRRRWPMLPLPAAILPLAATVLLAAPTAGQADNVYWSDATSGQLRVGNLNGTGAATLFAGEQEPQGIAINPSAGTIYWADATTGQIRVANLDGQGTPQTLYTEPEGSRPTGVAINAAAGKLYWTDAGTGQIRVGSLAGGSSPQTLYTEPAGSEPTGLAISSGAQPAGKLYWTDESTGTVREGPLAGGTAATLFTEPEGSHPSGIAVAASAGRLYWTDAGTSLVRYGPIGGGAAQTIYTEAEGATPRGIAIDAATGAMYFGDAGAGALRVAGLAGAGAPKDLFSAEPGAAFPAVLAAPAGTGIPKIAGPYNYGQTLVCGTGSWESNLPGASFYRAPQSYAYQWLRDGAAIAGAQAAAYLPSSEGSYTCIVTASNAAGAASQTSLPAVVKALPPTAAISAPASGSVYTKGQLAPTSFSCAEGAGGPGLASCTDSNGASAPAGTLDTSALGVHRYAVTAVSKNGMHGRTQITYTVIAPPPAPRPPQVSIISFQTKVRGRNAWIALGCGGGRSCDGVLSLTWVKTMQAQGVRRTRLTLFARASCSIGAGRHRAIQLRLSQRAVKLLAGHDGHLRVRARATVSGGATQHRGMVLRLAS
jgi:hypothetical protein